MNPGFVTMKTDITYKTLYENGIETLNRAGIAEAKLDARLLLECVCQTDHSTLLAHPDREISKEELDKYKRSL